MLSQTVALLLALVAAAAAQSCGHVYYNEQNAFMALPSKLTSGSGNSTGNQTGEAVMGGTEAKDGSWPWTVSICLKDWFGTCNFKGAGVIINKNYVMTVDSVVDTGEKATNYYVRLGSTSHKSGGWLIQAASHGIDGWLIFLELGQPAQFNNYVQPICLPSNDNGMTTPGNYAWFTSWGHVSSTIFSTDETDLHQGKMPFMEDDVCKNMYKNYDASSNFPTSEICAGGSGVTTCDASFNCLNIITHDVGGPLMRKKNGVWYLYGLSITKDYSGTSCKSATMFVRVSHYCPSLTGHWGAQCID